jgi:hypothetical protein
MNIASILSIFMITFERYFVICRPLRVRSLLTKSHILKLIFMIWTIAILTNLPYIYLTEYKKAYFFDKNTTEYKCVANVWFFYTIIVFYLVLFLKNNRDIIWMFILWKVNFVIYLLIGIVLVLMYHQISKYLQRSNKMLRCNFEKDELHECMNQNGTSIPNNLKLDVIHNVAVSSTKSFNYKNEKSADLHKPMLIKSASATDIDKKSKAKKIITNSGSSTSHQYILNKYIIPRKQLIFMIMCVIVIFYVCLFPLKIWALVLMFFAHKPNFPKIVDLRTFWYINITSKNWKTYY